MRGPRVLSDPPATAYMQRLDGAIATILRADPSSRRSPEGLPLRTLRHDGFDLLHVHLEAGEQDLPRLVDRVAAHRRRGDGIVLTVHDLVRADPCGAAPVDPDLVCQLMACANTVTTFTDGCADALMELTGRGAEVIPHGPLLPDTLRARLRLAGGLVPQAPHVLIVLGSSCSRADVEGVLDALTRAPFRVPVVVLADYDQRATTAARLAEVPGVRLETAWIEPGESLAARMASALLVVLPHTLQSHSPLAELAADVGAPVLTADTGHVEEQVRATLGGRDPLPPLAVQDGGVVGRDLAERLNGLWPETHLPGAAEADRERAAHSFHYHHERIYWRCLALSSGQALHPWIGRSDHHRPNPTMDSVSG